MVSQRSFWLALLAVVGLYAALALGHARTTVPWCDEAWMANPAYNLVREGHLGTTVLTEFGWGPPMNLDGIQERTYWIMPLHPLVQAGWYRLVGVGLLPLRSLSILWGAVALGSLALLVGQLTRSRAAAVGTALLAGLDYFVLTRAADGRMDMMSAALGFAALAAYVSLHRHLDRAVLLAATLAAASAFTHPVGGFLSLVSVGLLALLLDARRIRLRHVALAALPYVAGLLAWGLYVSQDADAFRAQMGSNAAGRLAALAAPWTAMVLEVEKYATAFGFAGAGWSFQNLRLLPLLAYLAGLAGVALTPVLRRDRGVQTLWLLAVVNVIALTLFDGAKRYYYLTYIVPLLAAVLATWLAWLWRQRPAHRPVLACSLVALLAVQLGGTAYRIAKDDYHRRYLPAVEFVRRAGGERVSLIGGAEIGFGLGFPDTLTDDVSLGYVSGQRPELIVVPEKFYRLWFRDMEQTLPAAVTHIRRLLRNEYRLVYNWAGYEVYRRR